MVSYGTWLFCSGTTLLLAVVLDSAVLLRLVFASDNIEEKYKGIPKSNR